MATDYPGRESEFDLGNGCSFCWFSDEDGTFGLIEHHPASDAARSAGALYCGGYVAWRRPDREPTLSVNHSVVSGGPGDEGRLTLAPSIRCKTCGHHGTIQDGAWVAV